MRQTDNCQLNQWESTDRILMEDFNSDNAKLDAALAQLRVGADRAGTTLLASAALSAAANYLSLSLADVDWSQYSTVTITYQYTASSTNSISVVLGPQQIGTLAGVPNAGLTRSAAAVVELYPMFDETHIIACSTTGMTPVEEPTVFRVPYSNIQLTSLSGLSMAAGTTIQVWGRK